VLAAAVNAAAGKTLTLTLSPSFTMEGYDGFIDMHTDGTVVTVDGNGAIFDAANYKFEASSFFYMHSNVSLTVRNVTMKNGHTNDFSAGAVYIGSTETTPPVGSSLTLVGCTFVNNTCTYKDAAGGALWFSAGTTGLIKGCSFIGPISHLHNDIQNYHGNVTFSCADDEVGTPVQMQGTEITVIPPTSLKCTAQTYACYNGGKANWKCVPDSTSTATSAQCHEVCAP
jgi:hypothetical protein